MGAGPIRLLKRLAMWLPSLPRVIICRGGLAGLGWREGGHGGHDQNILRRFWPAA